jgi:RNA polymerase sigma factor (sigma-70 family)
MRGPSEGVSNLDRRRLDDAELEKREFEAFFRKVFPKAVAISQRVTGERPAAQEAALEALAKAFVRWPKMRYDDRREMWVIKVAVNEAIKRLPKSRPINDRPNVVVGDHADGIVLSQILVGALRTLPKRQREVVVFRHILGLSESEVASSLEISLGTVKTHLRRGITHLRETVGASLKEENIA